MKKIVAFIIALSMFLSMGLSVFAEEEAHDEPNVSIQGNGGEFEIYSGSPENVWTTSGCGFYLTSGTLESNNIYLYEESIKYWTERVFEGWLVYSGTSSVEEPGMIDWVLVSDKAIDTQEMLRYDLNGYDYIMFEAKWEGNDENYYVDIMFDAFPGKSRPHDDHELVEAFGQKFKKGVAFSEQDIELTDPVRDNVTEETKFQGWIIIDIEENKIAEDESGNYILYSSGDINRMIAPEKEIRIAAKWADIPFEEYIGSGNGDSGEEPEPNVIFDCYGGRFVIDFGNNDIMDSDMFFVNINPGDKISNSGASIVPGFPERGSDFTFEGWLEFNMDTFEFVSSNPMTGNIFDKEIPEYKVCYIAKWKEIDFSQYVYGESHNPGRDARNIGFYAKDGRNIDILIDNEGINHGGSSLITQWSVPEGKTLDQVVKEEGFKEVDFIPVKDGVIFKSWDLVKADSITWKEHILGTEYVQAENETVLYQEILGAYQRYLVAENAEVLPQTFHTKKIFEIGDNKSYLAIAHWKHDTEIEIDGKKLNIVKDLEIKVPEALQEKFENSEEVKKELQESISINFESVSAEPEFIFMEISLVDEAEVPVEVPEEGLEIIIDYPYGTGSKGFDFVVAHLLDDGTVEIFSKENNNITLTKEGIVIKVNSLSPFAIGFVENGEPKEDINDGTNGNIGNGETEDDDENKFDSIFDYDFIFDLISGANNGNVGNNDETPEKDDSKEEFNPGTGAPVFFGR